MGKKAKKSKNAPEEPHENGSLPSSHPDSDLELTPSGDQNGHSNHELQIADLSSQLVQKTQQIRILEAARREDARRIEELELKVQNLESQQLASVSEKKSLEVDRNHLRVRAQELQDLVKRKDEELAQFREGKNAQKLQRTDSDNLNSGNSSPNRVSATGLGSTHADEVAAVRKKIKSLLKKQAAGKEEEFEKDLGAWAEKVAAMFSTVKELNREVEDFQEQLLQKERSFQEHLNKARTEMDNEIHQLTSSIVMLDEEQRKRIEYYEEKIALLISQVNTVQMTFADSGIYLDPETGLPHQQILPENVQFVAGTTSLVSSHLLRSYQPSMTIDALGNPWIGDEHSAHPSPKWGHGNGNHHEHAATGNGMPAPQLERPVITPRENEIVINGQVGPKGRLHEWIV